MVPQFETDGETYLKFLYHHYVSSFVRFSLFQCFLNSLPGVFTVPLTRMTDLLKRRIFFCFFQSMLFVIILLVGSLKPLSLSTLLNIEAIRTKATSFLTHYERKYAFKFT